MEYERARSRLACVAALMWSLAVGCGGSNENAPTTSKSTGAIATVETALAPASAAPSAAAGASNQPPRPTLPEFAPAPADDSPPRAFDMHCDTPWQVRGCDSCTKPTPGHDVALTEGQVTPDTLRRGHAGGIFLAIYLADTLHQGHPTIADAEAIMGTVDSIIEHHPETFARASAGDVPDDKVAAFVSIEGAGAFSSDIKEIDKFIERGVRFVGPVHFHDDAFATSATGADKTHGLTDLGKEFCERVYSDGALVDVSHMSDLGFDDVAVIAKKFHAPIVATHSNARAVANVPRNLTDDELRAIQDSDGVAGVNFFSEYLRKGGKASMDDAVKQALYMIKVAGIDHVGIGSDFDGSKTPSDLADASFYPAFGAALRKAGVSAHDVQKIFSENVKRVLRWKPDGSRRD